MRKSEAARAPLHSLDIVGREGKTVYTLCPPSKEEQLRWVCALSRAIAQAKALQSQASIGASRSTLEEPEVGDAARLSAHLPPRPLPCGRVTIVAADSSPVSLDGCVLTSDVRSAAFG